MSVRILTGDCRDVLRTLPDESVHCVVTSPPYYGLRDYGVTGQLGLEATPDAYVKELVGVFRECRRVLKNSGTCWINLGDSYAANRSYQVSQTKHQPHDFGGSNAIQVPPGLKPKDLIGIPWLVAFALRADGWYLRSDIIWSKPNPMPESVTDRPTKAHEYLFLLSKSARYFYDADAIREPHTRLWDEANGGNMSPDGFHKANGHIRARGHNYPLPHPLGANRRTVWSIATQPFSEAHFATFPPDLIEPCIKAGCPEHVCAKCGSPWVRDVLVESRPNKQPAPTAKYDGNGKHRGMSVGQEDRRERIDRGFIPSCECDWAYTAPPGVVLDPFGGAGTTGLVADRLQRNAILIELNPEYAAMAERRIHADAPLFQGVSGEARSAPTEGAIA